VSLHTFAYFRVDHHRHHVRDGGVNDGQCYIGVEGGSFAEIIITAFFGFFPQIQQQQQTLEQVASRRIGDYSYLLLRADEPRHFDGTLSHIRYARDQYFTIVSSADTGLTIHQET